jgi:hypothetical protein
MRFMRRLTNSELVSHCLVGSVRPRLSLVKARTIPMTLSVLVHAKKVKAAFSEYLAVNKPSYYTY